MILVGRLPVSRILSSHDRGFPMILNRPVWSPIPLVFDADAAKQRAMEAGVRMLQQTPHLPLPTCPESLQRHPVFGAVAEYATSFFGPDRVYRRLAQAEQIAWAAIGLLRCSAEISSREVLRVWPGVGLAWVLDRRSANLIRVSPGLVDVVGGPSEQTLLTCPLWAGAIEGLECLDSGDEFAAALAEVGIREDSQRLEEILEEGGRNCLRKIAAEQFSAKVRRLLGREFCHAC
jgi:hypothetical protein